VEPVCLCIRVALILIQTHQQELSITKINKVRKALKILGEYLPQNLKNFRDQLGFNLSALSYLTREMKANEVVFGEDEVVPLEKTKEDLKRKRVVVVS
jgi:hypothetical protein